MPELPKGGQSVLDGKREGGAARSQMTLEFQN